MTNLCDNVAVQRIVGVAMGTPDPVATLIEALHQNNLSRTFDQSWKNLISELRDLYHARDDDEAQAAIDEAHDALTSLRDRNYDNKPDPMDREIE